MITKGNCSYWVQKMTTKGNFNYWLQNLQLKLAAANGCKNCTQTATGRVTQLIVAVFATQIFAVCRNVQLVYLAYKSNFGSKRGI